MVKKTILFAILAAAVVLFGGLPAQANSLDVNENAALSGSVGTACNGSPCGLEVVVTDQGNAYVQSDHPSEEPTVTITFRIDPNDIDLPDIAGGLPGRFRILKAYREQGNNPRQHLFVTLKRNLIDTNYRIAFLQRDHNANFQFVGEFFLGNTDREIQIVWDKTGGGAGTGQVTVFRDGSQFAQRDLDLTQWNIDRVRMGAIDMTPDNFSATGSIYLDEYVSTR